MKLFRLSIYCFLALLNLSLFAQKKSILAKSKTKELAIDGKIEEDEWLENTETASNFIMFEPDNGKAISENKKTEVKVLYDNEAIYISALLYDDEPDKIQRELTERDVFGVADHFAVFINGFNDGQQDYRFYVSSTGVQMDCLATEEIEDFTWDAIWQSSVKITHFGWSVEMKIPYAAIRFPKSQKQSWGINFMREIKRNAQKFTWNHIDTRIGAVLTQSGTLEGIENINPPTRLFLIPYTSAYYQKDNFSADKTLKAGLDIKYGINDAFTLDAILIPDFGQTKFDNAILNLEPFEQKLDENRPFFTEGTNLFNIGNIFYSRRIGGTPIISKSTLEESLVNNEQITNYPSTVDLINAIKISGRTKKGLGIGFLNAITEKTFATIKNTNDNSSRTEVIEPLTNYNILVLDQRFRQNSSVSFINTNTSRNGNFRDANVSGLVFDLNTKGNTYNLSGDFKYSSINDTESYDGFKSFITFAKTSGKYRYLFNGKYTSKNFDSNDLGILFYTNYYSGFVNASYRILNPTKLFNTLKIEQEVNLDVDNSTNRIQNTSWIQTIITATTLKLFYFQLGINVLPFETYDFYEPRQTGRFLYIPRRFSVYLEMESNKNNNLTFDITPSIEKFDENKRFSYRIYAGPKYRFSDKFSLGFYTDYSKNSNNIGWVDSDNSGIIFAKRNIETLQNNLTGKYSINNKMTINLNARYYWSYSSNKNFYNLEDNGRLTANNSYNTNKNRNFNSWNFDFSYSWWFAPGSQLSLLYRNYSQEETNSIQRNLKQNINSVFNANMTNILSISLRYFIDYNSVKTKF
ncbi:hydrolase [Flavobacterium commune]|uniref:Hydrolase n=1 Tax=Flavobacterium commune TaxID=1306519 RepID=A0A1D9PAR5_9FLAO|nr:hydrolase [Flavobacterium commune]